MAFDVNNASLVAGGESASILPILIAGLILQPAVETLPSQLTGDTDTVLTAAVTGGNIRMFGFVKFFNYTETTLISTSGEAHLASGEAQWYTACVVQHRNAAAISIVYVPGDIAAVASVEKPSWNDIKTFLGKGAEDATIAILGDIRYHRSGDLVIDVQVDDVRRPFYTDDAKKPSSHIRDLADTSTLTAVAAGYVDLPIDLTSASGITPGNLLVDGVDLPKWPYGGQIDRLEYIGTVAGANSGADITLKAQIDGTVVTGSDLQLTLANTALPSKVAGGTPSAAYDFQCGDGLDLEVDAVSTAFTAGSGIVRVHLNRYE